MGGGRRGKTVEMQKFLLGEGWGEQEGPPWSRPGSCARAHPGKCHGAAREGQRRTSAACLPARGAPLPAPPLAERGPGRLPGAPPPPRRSRASSGGKAQAANGPGGPALSAPPPCPRGEAGPSKGRAVPARPGAPAVAHPPLPGAGSEGPREPAAAAALGTDRGAAGTKLRINNRGQKGGGVARRRRGSRVSRRLPVPGGGGGGGLFVGKGPAAHHRVPRCGEAPYKKPGNLLQKICIRWKKCFSNGPEDSLLPEKQPQAICSTNQRVPFPRTPLQKSAGRGSFL